MPLHRPNVPSALPWVLVMVGTHCATEPTVDVRAAALRARFDIPTLAPIPYPPNNGPNEPRVALGRLLFFDPILGGERDVSCGTCHHPAFAFADGRARSAGVSGIGLGPGRVLSTSAVTGRAVSETPRNAPTVLNSGYAANRFGQPSPHAPLFWDGRAAGLEEQALVPLTSRSEMRGDAFPTDAALDSIVARLRAIPRYVELFQTAFPAEAAGLSHGASSDIISDSTLSRAIAAYERALVTGNSPYDRFAGGDDGALSATEMDGLALFFSTAKCFLCHPAPTFGSFGYFVTGVPGVRAGDPPAPDDLGRGTVTMRPADHYAFRAPSLRNVELTAPYMHGGVFDTLEDVVRFYNDGARPRHPNVNQDDLEVALQTPLGLTDVEIDALVAFLRGLSGWDAVEDPRLFTVPPGVPSGLAPVFGVGGNPR